jgi:1-aminocyclopropane-1-carboxylate deaminase/D-cysteine desulfhydrase-like pyridoxal-dependent ACC family enzyme
MKDKKKGPSYDYIAQVGKLIAALKDVRANAVLVGGMALVVRGSQRVTKDFDLLISECLRQNRELMQLFYTHGFELVSKLNAMGEVVRTVDNHRVAYAKLQKDKVQSIYFYHPKSGLRVDVLFDFPLKAEEVFKRAQRKKIQSFDFYIASIQDMVAMKEIAFENRQSAKDQQDLEFLRHLLKQDPS